MDDGLADLLRTEKDSLSQEHTVVTTSVVQRTTIGFRFTFKEIDP